MIEDIHCRMGEGAGDIIGQMNTAHAWASYYRRPVRLNIHWGPQFEGDYKVVETDTESIVDRYQNVYDRLWMNHIVSFEHVFQSDMFAYLESLFAEPDNELRRQHKPKRWIFESGDPDDTMNPAGVDMPFVYTGGAEWKWQREPMLGKNIVFWNHRDNKDSIKEHKEVPFSQMNWRDIEKALGILFPRHNVVQVSYRDDFRYVHDLIADCAFCIGYDGMWHTVARNFGKLFISATDDLGVAHNATNPLAPIFRCPSQFFEFLHNCAYTEGFLEREQELAMSYHMHKIGLITWRDTSALENIVAI